MNKVVFMIPGQPIAWKRAHPGRGHSRPYDEQKHEKMVLGAQIRHQFIGKQPLKAPIHCQMEFYFPIPKNLHNKRNLYEGQLYPHKPDADNLSKFIMDVCQGIIYENDSAIASLIIKRLYDDGEGCRTYFYFEEC